MKKIFIALVLVMLAVFSASCGKDQPELPDYETNDIASKKEDNISSKPITKEKTSSKSKNLVSELTLKEYEELNEFMSIFYENFLGNYSSDNYTDVQLLDFINGWGKGPTPTIVEEDRPTLRKKMGISDDDASNYVLLSYSEQEVNDFLDKYFGKNVKPDSHEEWEYDNGNFYTMIPVGGYEIGNDSIVTSFTDNGDGTYNVEFNNYEVDLISDDFNENVYTVEQAEKANFMYFDYSGSAVIKEKIYNGEKTYELVEYDVKNVN